MAPTHCASQEQVEALFDFLEEHKDLARGKLRVSLEAKIRAKRLWEQICYRLNRMPGGKKTIQQWQKVWFDRKHLAKKAANEARKSDVAVPQFNDWELRVLSIVGDAFGKCQTRVKVPDVPALPDFSEDHEHTYSKTEEMSWETVFLEEEVVSVSDGMPVEPSEPSSSPEPMSSRQQVTDLVIPNQRFSCTASHEQVEALFDFLMEHKDLAQGRLRTLEGKTKAIRLWAEISNRLNSMGDCVKTVQQWQKVWSDRKHLAKKAATDAQWKASASGDDPFCSKYLSQWELKVLSIVGGAFNESHASADVSVISEDPDPTPPSPPLIIIKAEIEPTPRSVSPPVEDPEPVSQPEPLAQEPSTSMPRSESMRSRRRQDANSTADVRNRLFRIEERRLDIDAKRNTELAGIRGALLELCEILKNHLHNK